MLYDMYFKIHNCYIEYNDLYLSCILIFHMVYYISESISGLFIYFNQFRRSPYFVLCQILPPL